MSTVKSSAPGRAGTILRSALAVLAGLLFIAVSSTLLDQLFHSLGVYPPWGVPMLETGDNILAFAYRLVVSVAGCWLAARLAPRAPMAHALVLGSIGVVLSALGAFAMWEMSQGWYPIALIVIALPAAWLGGKLDARMRG